jgi:hypothetical protein
MIKTSCEKINKLISTNLQDDKVWNDLIKEHRKGIINYLRSQNFYNSEMDDFVKDIFAECFIVLKKYHEQKEVHEISTLNALLLNVMKFEVKIFKRNKKVRRDSWFNNLDKVYNHMYSNDGQMNQERNELINNDALKKCLKWVGDTNGPIVRKLLIEKLICNRKNEYLYKKYNLTPQKFNSVITKAVYKMQRFAKNNNLQNPFSL